MDVFSSTDNLWQSHFSLWHQQFMLPLALPATAPHSIFLPLARWVAFYFPKIDNRGVCITIFLSILHVIVCLCDTKDVDHYVDNSGEFVNLISIEFEVLVSGISDRSSRQHLPSVNITSSESEKKLSEGVSQIKTRILFEGLDYSERECATSVSDYTAWTDNIFASCLLQFTHVTHFPRADCWDQLPWQPLIIWWLLNLIFLFYFFFTPPSRACTAVLHSCERATEPLPPLQNTTYHRIGFPACSSSLLMCDLTCKHVDDHTFKLCSWRHSVPCLLILRRVLLKYYLP